MDPRLESIDFSQEYGKCHVFGCNVQIVFNGLCECHLCTNCYNCRPCSNHRCCNCQQSMTKSVGVGVFCSDCSRTNPMKYHLKGYVEKKYA